MLAVALAYVVAISAIMLWRGVSLSPDYLLLLLAPVVLLAGRFSLLIGDWVPFVAIVLGYEAMGGVVLHDGLSPQVTLLANVETWLFAGHDPSQVLQHAVSGTTLRVLAVVATAVYFCHFVLPLVVGLALWLRDRTQYLRFVTALLGMCLVTYLLFLLVPTAPPWYAAQQHVLSGVTDLIRSQNTLPAAVSPLYSRLDPNPIAAFPSLHAAFPFLGFLSLRRVYPRGSWILLGWSSLVFVSVVFLGEHYVVDVIGGVLLASASWWVMMCVVVPHVTVLRTARPVLEAPAAPAGAGAAHA
jgi:membrane-associated phospholipid phosphatase